MYTPFSEDIRFDFNYFFFKQEEDKKRVENIFNDNLLLYNIIRVKLINILVFIEIFVFEKTYNL